MWEIVDPRLGKFNMSLPFRIRQIYVGPEFNDLSNRFLLWAGERHKPNMNMLRCNTVTFYTNRSQFFTNLRELLAWGGWALLKMDAELAFEVWLPLLLDSVRAAFVAADWFGVCSSSSSFSLSFSSYNTSAWA